MARRALVRGSVAAIAAFAMAAGFSPLIASATADTPPEAVIPPVMVPRLHADTFSTAGGTGYVFRAEGAATSTWRSYDGQVVRDLGASNFTPRTVRFPDGREWLAAAQAVGVYGTYDIAADEWTSHTLPSGQGWLDSFGTDDGLLTVSYANVRNADNQLTGHSLHLLTGEGDAIADRPVSGWPEGAFVSSIVRRGDGRGLLLSYIIGDDRHVGLVDFASGALVWSKSWGAHVPPPVVLDEDRFGWYEGDAVHLLSRTDPSAAGTTVAVPRSPSGNLVANSVALSGDSVLARYQANNTPGGVMYPLVAVPVGGGAATTLLADASNLVSAADGGALVVGGTGYEDWAAHRVTPDGSGGFRTEPVRWIGNASPERYGLALGRGKLRFAEGVANADGSLSGLRHTRDMGTSAAPGTGQSLGSGGLMTNVASCAAGTAARCAEFFAAGQDVAFVRVGDDGKDSVVVDASPDPTSRTVALDSSGGRLVDADDAYAVYDSRSNGKQYVLDIRDGYAKLKLTRTIRAASVWGTTLWSAGSKAGEVTSYDLTTGKTTATLATTAPCVVEELQALGRWLYWSCGTHGAAGVYDRTAKKNIAVPSGEALLGDGFVVRHAGDALVLTDVHTGTATTRTLAALPASPLPSDRRVTWTVDKYRGHIAYTDAAATTHVLSAGVPASALGTATSSVDNQVWPRDVMQPWTAAWTFSGPVSSWSVEIRNKATGKLYTTLKGGAVRSAVQVTWNGRDAAKALVPSGMYTWTLRAVPANGQGATFATSGTISVTMGDEIFHGFGPDGVPDVFTLTSDNRLLQRPGTTGGAFGAVTDAAIPRWPSGTGFVPFGDLKKNDCNDMLVRTAAGQLRLYGGDCENDAFTPKGSYTSLGTGFQQYNVLTSAGDVTGDRIPDLIARKSSTSDVYLYKGTSSGKLSARVKLASKWTGYKKVVGAGDLNGDGIGDLLAQDKSNVLWRYNGDGRGHLKPRVKVASDWGASYNAVLGIGDSPVTARPI
ncbi:VCBS repeat-containing protein [Actinacidiphila glaucinigra]|uniref:VCBS repeat-containing protein n=1 Tax=Actinacidiphila glaucinigra TaxID=235986 RepID=UPI0033AC4740